VDPAATFARDGYLVIDRLFDPALIDAVREEYERQFGDLSEDRLPSHLNVGDRRVQLPIALQGPLLDPMLGAHPLLMRMLESLLGRDFLIDNATVVVALPGAQDQSLHRDHHELFPGAAESGEGLGAYAITVSIPLVDLTAETGSTKLFTGSHRTKAGSGKPQTLSDAEMPYMAKGGCYLMDYRLWHHGTANRSPDPRPILYLVYSRPWFTDMLNFADMPRLQVANDELMNVPAGQRRLFRRLTPSASDS
jgi:hypothetical protein